MLFFKPDVADVPLDSIAHVFEEGHVLLDLFFITRANFCAEFVVDNNGLLVVVYHYAVGAKDFALIGGEDFFFVESLEGTRVPLGVTVDELTNEGFVLLPFGRGKDSLLDEELSGSVKVVSSFNAREESVECDSLFGGFGGKVDLFEGYFSGVGDGESHFDAFLVFGVFFGCFSGVRCDCSPAEVLCVVLIGGGFGN